MKSNPFEVLGLPSTATQEEVKAKWRALASIEHPDHGGDKDKFFVYHEAYKKALEFAKVCKKCNGTGQISKRQGFHTLTLACECKRK